MEPLERALNDADSRVRKSAAEALDTLGWTPGRDEAAAAYWIAKGQWDKCDTIGEPAVPPLIRALNDADSRVRKSAAEALGKIGGVRAVRTLIRALNDSDWDVRSGAAEALGRIGEPAVEPLINALNNSDTTGVRVNAAQALGRIGDSRAVKPLERALNDADSRVRKSAAEALRRFGLQENRWGTPH